MTKRQLRSATNRTHLQKNVSDTRNPLHRLDRSSYRLRRDPTRSQVPQRPKPTQFLKRVSLLARNQTGSLPTHQLPRLQVKYPKCIHSAISVHVALTVALRIRISARSMRSPKGTSNRHRQISVDIVYRNWFNPQYLATADFFFTLH